MGSKQGQQMQANTSKTPTKANKKNIVTQPSFITRAVTYFQAAQVELGKVSWPTWKEVKVTGYAVAALVVAMALFLGLADVILSWIVNLILSTGV